MLKRLEIQCVFKELVKDIVVKGHVCKSTTLSLILQHFVNETKWLYRKVTTLSLIEQLGVCRKNTTLR